MIVVATSGANQCLYCVVAHGAILRIREKNPMLADQVAVNHRKADITPRQRAMLDFAMKVCLRRPTSTRADFEGAQGAASRRGHLGHRRDHRAVRAVQPHGQSRLDAARSGSSPARARAEAGQGMNAARWVRPCLVFSTTACAIRAASALPADAGARPACHAACSHGDRGEPSTARIEAGWVDAVPVSMFGDTGASCATSGSTAGCAR